jgi:hypothetical protein
MAEARRQATRMTEMREKPSTAHLRSLSWLVVEAGSLSFLKGR